MPSFDQSFSSSPVLVLPPSQPAFNMNPQRPTFTSPFNGAGPLSTASSNLTPNSAPPSAAGRKRSRDEAADNLEDEYFQFQAAVVQPEPENEDEWEYGEGMTLIKPNKGYVMEASSQTGTWAEEKAAEEERAQTALASASPERPILRAAKSQRLDLAATPSIAEEVLSNGTLLSAPSPERTHVEPTVDDFTRHLGIGWSSISADVDIQAAARGWTKFIENHFPVTNAKIQLQSKGLASYLVEANEGYFLFGEDLKQGRLVSTSLEKTWVNLRGPVPLFEGDAIMEAITTPKADEATQSMTNGDHVAMNGVVGGAVTNGGGSSAVPATQQHVDQTVEVEMDMS